MWVLLLERPFSLKDFEVAFNHVKSDITLVTEIIRKGLKWSLVTIYDPFSIEFQPQRQLLLPNLLLINSFIHSDNIFNLISLTVKHQILMPCY